jgi:hypothetical protein
VAKYEFECPAHGIFEIERSLLEPAPQTADCPAKVPDWLFENGKLLCGEKSRRVFSAPGVVFRWHH